MRHILCILFFAANAFGQLEGNPQNWCRNGAFPRESDEYKLAKIIGNKREKIYFYGDEDNCPKGNNCRLKSYVIPNDEIIVSRTFGNFACSWFQPKKGSEAVGWIAVDKIEYVEASKTPELKDWLGNWKYATSSIRIAESKTKDFLAVTGDAIWKGLGDNVHISELDHSAKPSGNVLKLGETADGEFDCNVTLRFVGKFLIASDNLNCGGANVTFSGVYQK